MGYVFLLLSLALGVPAAPAVASYSSLSRCGIAQWHIISLDDPGVNKVNAVPQTLALGVLRSFPVSGAFTAANGATRYVRVELTEYKLRNVFVGFKEETDRACQVVFSNPSLKTVSGLGPTGYKA